MFDLIMFYFSFLLLQFVWTGQLIVERIRLYASI